MTATVQLQLGTAQARLDAVNNRLYVGRDPACGLTTPDPSLSRRHAEVFLEGGYAYIRDLGSSNGTWIDGQLVGGQATPLMPGQTVFLGMVPLVATWHGGAVDGGRTMAVAMPPELRALVEARRSQIQALSRAPAAAPGGPGAPAAWPQGTSPQGLGVGGRPAPLPAELAYRRQGANGNGVLLIALRQDTFANDTVVDGFLEFTATDDETVASITIDLVEHHERGPAGGHVWDRMLVRQGPWRARKGDVLPLPFQLRVPPGTSPSGRHVHWELRGYVDINWASDIEATCPIHMRNSDIERVRDALGSLDYRVADLTSKPLGQRFEGVFHPPAQLADQLGINQINLAVEYLGANLKVEMEVDRKGMFKRDRETETVFELARFRAAPLSELVATFRQQIDRMMAPAS
ncbi:MAG TPA: FHA domain-containing protein [Kofleriaceae bacterium]|nr:FHA domain-containing protein [Kofleriaceae bacterium]